VILRAIENSWAKGAERSAPLPSGHTYSLRRLHDVRVAMGRCNGSFAISGCHGREPQCDTHGDFPLDFVPAVEAARSGIGMSARGGLSRTRKWSGPPSTRRVLGLAEVRNFAAAHVVLRG
jgi:hypothetical protein